MLLEGDSGSIFYTIELKYGEWLKLSIIKKLCYTDTNMSLLILIGCPGMDI